MPKLTLHRGADKVIEIDQLIADCEKAAAFYEQSPGLVQPATIIDLYRAIARLAALVKPK